MGMYKYNKRYPMERLDDIEHEIFMKLFRWEESIENQVEKVKPYPHPVSWLAVQDIRDSIKGSIRTLINETAGRDLP
jgi:hypothetical protein